MEGNIIRRAFGTFRAEGLEGVWRKVQNRLSEKMMCRWLLVLDLPLTDDFSVIEPKIPVTFEELQPSDFDELIALRPYLTEEVIRMRLKAGHRFYVAKSDGKIVHNRLVAIDKVFVGYLGIAFPLSPQEIYFGEAYTVSEYRGNHISPACRSFVISRMREQGYNRAVMFIYFRNHPSLRSAYRGGFQKKGYIGFLQVLGFRRYFYWAKDGGLDCLNNTLLTRWHELVPAEIQGQVW